MQFTAIGEDRFGSIGEYRIFVIGMKTGKGDNVYGIGKV
jgi:hypothetical protein